jgi:spore coat protein U-like protein
MKARVRSVAAAAAALLIASPVARADCTFNSAGGTIAFGSLDPSVANTRTAFVNLSIKCTPAGTTPTWSFSGDNGNAPLQMKHSTQNAFIPYSVATSLQSSSGSNQTWRVTGTVLGTNYQNALVGAYSDRLTATITP